MSSGPGPGVGFDGSTRLCDSRASIGEEAIIPRIRALLVGVDEYEHPDVPRLRGCVNDVVLVRDVLRSCFAVPNRDIRVLVNRRATKANILDRLQAAIRQAERGDVIVFFFSGHGSQIRDRDGDELTDALDELICPYDMDWDRRTYILDDDLDRILGQAGDGVVVEALFDCCFWGASPQEFPADPRPQATRSDLRYLIPPLDIAARVEGEEHAVENHRLVATGAESGRNVFWAGSAEGEPAGEDAFEGRAYGAFTYWGCRLIQDHAEHLDRYTREQLLEDVRACLWELGYPQTPELVAPPELRAAEPFTSPAAWDAWAHATGSDARLRRRRERAARAR